MQMYSFLFSKNAFFFLGNFLSFQENAVKYEFVTEKGVFFVCCKKKAA